MKPAEHKRPKVPFILKELVQSPAVRNVQPISPNSQEYQLEMTDGSGFDNTNYKVYLLQEKTTLQPILSTVLDKGVELFSSKFIEDKCYYNGVSAVVKKGKAILTMKLSNRNSNALNIMKFYDLLLIIKTFIEFRETINNNVQREDL